MRRVFFTVPETDVHFGGYTAEMDCLNLVSDICETELLTFERRCSGVRFLDDVIQDTESSDTIFMVHWGPNVPSLVRQLKGRNVVYHAYSSGYGFTLPVDVPDLGHSLFLQM